MTLCSAFLSKANRFWEITVCVNDADEKTWNLTTQYGVIDGVVTVNTKTIKGTEKSARSQFMTRVKTQINRSGYTLNTIQGIEEEVSTEPERPAVMLCHELQSLDNVHIDPKFNFVYVQPKLDGVRAIMRNGVFYTRSGQIITCLDHIAGAGAEADVILDGELWSPDMTFNDLSGLIRRKEADKSSVQYHVFDIVNMDVNFHTRYNYLQSLKLGDNTYLVNTYMSGPDELSGYHDLFTQQKYEGIIIRQPGNMYVNRRATTCLKYKTFFDAEFYLDGMTASDTGKEKGMSIMILRTNNGNIFTCRPCATHEDRYEQYNDYLRNPESYVGRLYRVRYQEIDEVSGIPRFPVGVGFVDDR